MPEGDLRAQLLEAARADALPLLDRRPGGLKAVEKYAKALPGRDLPRGRAASAAKSK